VEDHRPGTHPSVVPPVPDNLADLHRYGTAVPVSGRSDGSGGSDAPAAFRRPLTPGLVPVVEALRPEQGRLVTLDMIEDARRRAGVATRAVVIASRLRSRGWLLPTKHRGVYEFAPAADPGRPARSDSLLALEAALLRRPELRAALTFRSAAWALGVSDAPPARLELAVPDAHQVIALSQVARGFLFRPALDPVRVDGVPVPVLAPESVLVHLAAKPGDVRYWSTALGWLPRLAALVRPDRLGAELAGRNRPVSVRLGYLLSGVRPELAADLRPAIGARVPFGTRGRARRVDPTWHVVDRLLPLSPDLLEPWAGG
jgi:AbiEi antitoxin C-terminal domain